jgi:hypothetical protein
MRSKGQEQIFLHIQTLKQTEESKLLSLFNLLLIMNFFNSNEEQHAWITEVKYSTFWANNRQIIKVLQVIIFPLQQAIWRLLQSWNAKKFWQNYINLWMNLSLKMVKGIQLNFQSVTTMKKFKLIVIKLYQKNNSWVIKEKKRKELLPQ